MPKALLAGLFVALLTVSQAFASQWDGSWVWSTAGQSTVEVPSFLEGVRDFMEHGVDHGTDFNPTDGSSFWLQQFWVTASDRPYSYINRRWAGSIAKITYQVDHQNVGIISAFEGQKHEKAFYEICRRTGIILRCVSMGWETSEQSRAEKLVTRVVASFTK